MSFHVTGHPAFLLKSLLEEQEAKLLLQSFHLNIFSPPREPGAERWTVKAALDDDIGDALPYLERISD